MSRARHAARPGGPRRAGTNDFMYSGGDGYTSSAGGTNVLSPVTTSSRSPSTTSREFAGRPGGRGADRRALSPPWRCAWRPAARPASTLVLTQAKADGRLQQAGPGPERPPPRESTGLTPLSSASPNLYPGSERLPGGLSTSNAATLPQHVADTLAVATPGGAMSDDRPPAPTYGPPITIPSAYFLGRVAYNAWCDAHLDDPAVDWMELSEAERAMWQRIATKVAERSWPRHRAEPRARQLPATSQVPGQRRDLYSFYICCRWDSHPAETGADDEGHRWVPVEP